MSQNRIEVIHGEPPLDLLRRCGGYYKCPKKDGKRVGPLVAYAGKYQAPDGKKKSYVGDEYANFAKIECRGNVLRHVAAVLYGKICTRLCGILTTGFVGMPLGGLKLSSALGHVSGLDDIYPEKKVTVAGSATSKEESILVWGRHEPVPGGSYVLVEDVCNNFSTTNRGIDLVLSCGAFVIGIACFLNRSPKHRVFYPYGERQIPIIALVEHEIPEYTQEDPFVSAEVEVGNVNWDPKKRWQGLATAMAQAV